MPRSVSIAAFCFALLLAFGSVAQMLGYEAVEQKICRFIGACGLQRDSVGPLPQTGVDAFDRAMVALAPRSAQIVFDQADRKLAFVCTERGGNGGWLLYVRDADADRRQYGLFIQFSNLLPGTAPTQYMPQIADMGNGVMLFTHTRDVPNLGITSYNLTRVFVVYRQNTNRIMDSEVDASLQATMSACSSRK